MRQSTHSYYLVRYKLLVVFQIHEKYKTIAWSDNIK